MTFWYSKSKLNGYSNLVVNAHKLYIIKLLQKVCKYPSKDLQFQPFLMIIV